MLWLVLTLVVITVPSSKVEHIVLVIKMSLRVITLSNALCQLCSPLPHVKWNTLD